MSITKKRVCIVNGATRKKDQRFAVSITAPNRKLAHGLEKAVWRTVEDFLAREVNAREKKA